MTKPSKSKVFDTRETVQTVAHRVRCFNRLMNDILDSLPPGPPVASDPVVAVYVTQTWDRENDSPWSDLPDTAAVDFRGFE